MNTFDHAFAKVIGVEGRYSNNPADSGGETMFGITVAVARANGYAGPMRGMPIDVAKRIYRSEYWDALKLDAIADLHPRLAHELFDTGVNCGIGIAGRFLQRALNGLNKRGELYSDIAEDGRIGNVTVSAIRQLSAARGKRDAEIALLRLCDGQQIARYLDLSQSRPKDEAFLFGWIINRTGTGET